MKSEEKSDKDSFNSEAPESSAVYIQDKETGEWKIVNPAGSMVYNYMDRSD